MRNNSGCILSIVFILLNGVALITPCSLLPTIFLEKWYFIPGTSLLCGIIFIVVAFFINLFRKIYFSPRETLPLQMTIAEGFGLTSRMVKTYNIFYSFFSLIIFIAGFWFLLNASALFFFHFSIFTFHSII
jgi:hypothetical protein